jgi:branched-chain amino acid aminotransferase
VYWLNGRIVPSEQACIPLTDHGLLYGDGVFEGIRFYHGHALRLPQHVERLYCSARALNLVVPCNERELTAAIAETIAAYGEPNGYLRLVVTRGTGKLGLDPKSCARPNMFMIADVMTMVSAEVRERGARVIISATRRLSPDGLDPRIKSLNYLNHIMARMEAANAGADEAILLNAQGRVTEGTTENLFVVRAGAIYTPPASDGALQGITRALVIELADELDIACAEVSLTAYDLYTADECFLTGTGAELIPVREVDGRALTSSPGPVFARVQQAFKVLVDRECGSG